MQNGYANDSLHEPSFHKRPPHHPYDPLNQGCINNSYGVFALPFPIGYPGKLAPYAKGAMGFREMDSRFQYTSHFAAGVQLTFAALQLTSNGTPVFEGRPGTPATRDAMMAYIRAIEKRPTKEDLKAHGKGMHQDFTFDQAVAESIHAIVSGAFNDTIPGREDMRNGRGARGRDDDLQDGIDVDMRYDDEDDRRGGGRGRRRGRNYREEDEEEEGEDVENEMDLRIRELLDEMLEGAEGETVIEKVKIIFVHYTRPQQDDEGRPLPNLPEEDAGCIMFGFIMDPLYSLGKNFARIVEMCEEHANMRTGMRAGNGIVDSEVPQKRQRYTPGAANVSDLIKHFPWLNAPEHTGNALLHMTKHKYVDLVAFVRNDPTMLLGLDSDKVMQRGMEDPGTAGNPNPLHPINVFTPNWAIKVMQQYGVPSDKCSMAVLKGDPAWDAIALAAQFDLPPIESDEEDDGAAPVVAPGRVLRESMENRWYVPPADSYWYKLRAVLWAKNGFAGLHAQYFPWVAVPEQLLRMSAARSAGNTLALYDGEATNNTISKEYELAIMREGVGFIDPLPTVPYDPNAMVRHSAIIQMAEENARMMKTLRGPRDPQLQPEEYKQYCRDLKDYRSAFMMRALQVLTPTAHINVSTQIILTFMAREVRRVSTYLPHYDWDPDDATPEMFELDSFAQFMIREALDICYARHVVGPARAWQTTHYGVQDCHSTTNVDMHYSVIFHGPPEAGKSFVVKDATVKTCIPDSVTTMLESSNRAFNTHDDVSGCIFFKDEVDDIYVNAKAAERDRSGTAERLKTMLTDHKTTYRVLVFVDQSNGRQRRMAEDIESLFHATFACATNKKCSGGDEAIVSRFLNFVMTKADCNLYDYLGLNGQLDDEDTLYNNDLVKTWRIKQGLLCIAQVLVDANVLPEPSMDVFSKIQSKFFAYLSHQGVDVSKIRGTQMTQRLARIYVFLNGLIQLYDRPGAKYMDKVFDMSQLIDLIPYLYCTKQIAIFAMTQTSEIYIHPTRVIALRAAFAFGKFPYVEGKTIEEYIREDLSKSIMWRIDHHDDADKASIDFNYIKLSGKFKDTIIAGIAEHCEPKLGVNETESEIIKMSKVFIRVHAVKSHLKSTYEPVNNLVNQTTIPWIPARDTDTSLIPVVVRDYANDFVYVAIEALGQLDEDLLINAFGSCIHDKFRPQKFLLGLHVAKPHPSPNKEGVVHHYNHIYRTVEITPEVIENCSVVSAFTVPDVACIPLVVRQMMSGARRDPDKQFNGETYSTNRVKRTQANIEIDEDLDDWGHELHHYRAGCPGSHLDSCSRQITIYNEIRANLKNLENKHRQNDRTAAQDLRIPVVHDRAMYLNYPYDILLHVDSILIAQEEARSNTKVTKILADTYTAESEEFKVYERKYKQAQLAKDRLVAKKKELKTLKVPRERAKQELEHYALTPEQLKVLEVPFVHFVPKLGVLAKQSDNIDTFRQEYKQYLPTDGPNTAILAIANEASHKHLARSKRLSEARIVVRPNSVDTKVLLDRKQKRAAKNGSRIRLSGSAASELSDFDGANTMHMITLDDDGDNANFETAFNASSARVITKKRILPSTRKEDSRDAVRRAFQTSVSNGDWEDQGEDELHEDYD